MFAHSLFQKDATPLLRSMGQFLGKRHQLLVQDIANVDTPFYRSKKLDLGAFQSNLRQAVEQRRTQHPRHFQIGSSAQLRTNASAVASTTGLQQGQDSFLGTIHQRATSTMPSIGMSQVRAGLRGDLSFNPRFTTNDGVYRYDETSGSIDKTMSDLAKNTLMKRTFGALLGKKYRMLDTAISERI